MLGKLPHAWKEPRQIDAFPQADRTKFALLPPLPHKQRTLLPDMPLKSRTSWPEPLNDKERSFRNALCKQRKKAISWQLQQQA